MLKYKIAQKGQAVNLTQELSKIQRRAGINITGELDVATKKVVPYSSLWSPPSQKTPNRITGTQLGSAERKRYTLQGTKWQKEGENIPEDQVPSCETSLFSKRAKVQAGFELKRLRSSSLEEASSKDLSTKIVRQAVPSCDCSLRPNKRN